MIDDKLERLRKLCDQTAVVGVGATQQGRYADADQYSLAIDALQAALDDCGLVKDELDGLIVQGPGGISFVRLGEMLGINPAVGANLAIGGLATGALIQYAAMLLHVGMCRNVALVYGNASHAERRRFGGETVVVPGSEFTSSSYYYGLTSPGAASAFQARVHFETYGTTSRQLAAVAVAARKHAALNPLAIFREPLTVEQHQASPYVVEPLHLNDYCPVNDGGVAMILTTSDRARDLKKRPVYIRGIGRQDTYRGDSMPNHTLWRDTGPKVGDMVFGMAGITRKDIDAVMIYDSFTINVWIALENFGFCRPGEAGDFTQDGRIELGGELPVNTSGGHLSEGYMQGWLHQVEAVRQLRAECGARQVPDAQFVQYLCRGNLATSIIYRN